MFHWLIAKLKYLLPTFIVLAAYRGNKALPLAFATANGNKYRAVMIDHNYGFLICQEKYDPDRINTLKSLNQALEDKQAEVLEEINSLDFAQKEAILADITKGRKKDAR